MSPTIAPVVATVSGKKPAFTKAMSLVDAEVKEILPLIVAEAVLGRLNIGLTPVMFIVILLVWDVPSTNVLNVDGRSYSGIVIKLGLLLVCGLVSVTAPTVPAALLIPIVCAVEGCPFVSDT